MKMNKNMKNGFRIAEEKYLPMLDQKEEEINELLKKYDAVEKRLDNSEAEALGAKQEALGAKQEALGAKQEAEHAKQEAEHAKQEAEHAKQRADAAEEEAALAKIELEIGQEEAEEIKADIQNIREEIFSKINMANKTMKETDNEIKTIDNEIAAENEVINFDVYEDLPKKMKITDSIKTQVLIQQLEAADRVKEHEKHKKKIKGKKNKAQDDRKAAYAEIGKLFVEKFGTHNVYGELEY